MKIVEQRPICFYAKQLIDLFQKSISESDPALYLYKKDARKLLFMTESLLRMEHEICSNKKTEKNNAKIKKLEDLLGQMDENEVLVADLNKHKSVKHLQIQYFQHKYDKALMRLNKKLVKKEFFQSLFNKLLTTNALNIQDEKLVSEIKSQLEKDINECADFFKKFPAQFDSMEEQVHELRRKLRWISIYGESLNGLIVLKEDKKKYTWEKQFITKETKALSFNKLSLNKNLSHSIYYNQKAFMALNFVIEHLGNIKDDGLRIESLIKSSKTTLALTSAEAEKLAISQLNSKETKDDLLKRAHSLLNDFFIKYKIHELLISQ